MSLSGIVDVGEEDGRIALICDVNAHVHKRMHRHANTILMRGGNALRPIAIELADRRMPLMGVIAHRELAIFGVELSDVQPAVGVDLMGEFGDELLQLERDDGRCGVELGHDRSFRRSWRVMASTWP